MHSISSGFENMAQQKGNIGVIWRYYKIDTLSKAWKFGIAQADRTDFSNAANISKSKL